MNLVGIFSSGWLAKTFTHDLIDEAYFFKKKKKRYTMIFKVLSTGGNNSICSFMIQRIGAVLFTLQGYTSLHISPGRLYALI